MQGQGLNTILETPDIPTALELHYQVLVNAEKLKGLDAVTVCIDGGVPETYATEFRKMIGLAKLMKEQGSTISAK